MGKVALWIRGWVRRTSDFFKDIFFTLKFWVMKNFKQQQSKVFKYLIFLEIHNKIIL